MRFSKAMAARTDDELVAIVTGPPEDWEPDALDAARTEVAKRGLVFEPRPSSRATRASDPAFRSEGPPLEPRMKVLALMFGVFMSVLGVLIALALLPRWKKKGERRRGIQFVEWTAIGALIVMVLTAMVR